jgi:hypothetical protein
LSLLSRAGKGGGWKEDKDDDNNDDNDDDDDDGGRGGRLVGMGVGEGAGAGGRGASRSRRTMIGWMQSRSECVFFSSGKTEVIGQGTAPELVPMTSVFFGLFSHTLKIKPTLDNTFVGITPSFVLL